MKLNEYGEYEHHHLNALLAQMFYCAYSGDYKGVCENGQDAIKETNKLFEGARNICVDVKEDKKK
jgi:hypothetical protein